MGPRAGDANKAIRRKVCIIGAGPSGLITIKLLAEHLDEFEPIAFERNSDVGGLWIYTDDTDFDQHGLPVHSSVYKNLRTNTPKETMSCPDYPNFEGEQQSCVKHETVVEYQKNYAKHFNLRQFIKFNTYVEKITRVPNDEDRQKTKWHVKIRDLKMNASQTIIYDVVIVCAGQFYKGMIPEIPGIDKSSGQWKKNPPPKVGSFSTDPTKYPGRVLHSHSYRKPEEFANQTVTLLGAAVSGRDLSFDLSSHVKTVYLSHRKKKIQKEMPSNVIQIPGVVAADIDGLILSDGSKIQSDALIYCTGYINDLPFLDPSCGVEVNERYLYPLYKQIINIENPTMGFVGLVPSFKAFCPKFYAQAKYYVSFLLGEFKLPNHENMVPDAEIMMPDKLEAMDDDDWHWDYVDELAREGNFDKLPDFYRRGVAMWRDFRAANWLHFKEYNLKVSEDGGVAIVKSKATDE